VREWYQGRIPRGYWESFGSPLRFVLLKLKLKWSSGGRISFIRGNRGDIIGKNLSYVNYE